MIGSFFDRIKILQIYFEKKTGFLKNLITLRFEKKIPISYQYHSFY